MNKRLITSYRGGILTAVWENRRVIQFEWEQPASESKIGNIYVGIVKKIVPSINAAFVEVESGLNGYYSLEENTHHLFLTPGNHDRVKEGDLLLVQVERDPVKTKLMVLTARINLTGRYTALTCGHPGLAFSSKIKGVGTQAFKDHIRETLKDFPVDEYGLIVRTNAAGVEPERIAAEANALLAQMEKLLREAACRTSGSLMMKAAPAWIQGVRDAKDDELEEVVCEGKAQCEELIAFVREVCPDMERRIRLYEDDYSLMKLYRLESALEEALSERVWLKSGGFLVIQPTEALTVIDVNSGKSVGKKTSEETFFHLNLEAAKEIAHQIRLRNLSGIIIVDFIDMDEEEHKLSLMAELKRLLETDPVKTNVIDMTPLGLVEITRKRVRRPLAEQFK